MDFSGELKEKKQEELVFADLHIHSRFSRACSKDLTIENLEKWARVKGLNLLGTGDFTHPIWVEELRSNLVDNGFGIFLSKTGFKFILTGEISLMYTQGRGRSVHLVMLVPSFEIVDKINRYLDSKGRRDYDGRPIFKISCEQFTKDMLNISREIEIIPAHCWTPYFGVFGSESGFDSLKEAFGEEFSNIHAIETGMSSDPQMNWLISELNTKAIVSFSDSHSFWPWRMGREATIFGEIKTYRDLIDSIRNNEILGTIETDPAYGKYHYDGHINCKFSSSPEETKKLGGLCPICKKELTIGVENRVLKLENQKIEDNKNRKPYFKILPLHELIALAKASSLISKKTWAVYNSMIEKFGNEFNILLFVNKNELNKFLPNDALLVDLIIRNRNGEIQVKPGYDGVYGEPMLEEKQEKLF
jgi:uncharacterized protein (TIGR00375 family)